MIGWLSTTVFNIGCVAGGAVCAVGLWRDHRSDRAR